MRLPLTLAAITAVLLSGVSPVSALASTKTEPSWLTKDAFDAAFDDSVENLLALRGDASRMTILTYQDPKAKVRKVTGRVTITMNEEGSSIASGRIDGVRVGERCISEMDRCWLLNSKTKKWEETDSPALGYNLEAMSQWNRSSVGSTNARYWRKGQTFRMYPTGRGTNASHQFSRDMLRMNGPWFVYDDAASAAVTVPAPLQGHAYTLDVDVPAVEVSLPPGISTPTAPRDFIAISGDRQATISWSAPESNGGSAIVAYTLSRGPSADGPWSTLVTTSGPTIHTDAGLINGTAYWYRVTATNSIGEGASAVASVIPRTLPDAPTAFAATPGDRQVALAWSPPTSDGGAAITGYRLYRSVSSQGPWMSISSPTTTSHVVRELSNGTQYWFRITAVTTVGEGAAAVVASTPRTSPAVPTNLSAKAGDTQVALSWDAPSSDGGAVVSGYRVYRGSSAEGPWGLVGSPTATNFVDRGLTNGTTYWYRVTAVNEVGEGAGANISALPRTVPTAPTGLAAVAGSSDVALTWAAPSSNGGAPILYYSVYRSTSPSGPWTSVISTVHTTYTDTGLAPGQTYWFMVTAGNTVGEGTGATLSATVFGPFLAPTLLSATPAGVNTEHMYLSFTPGSTGGRVISLYQYSPDNGTTWKVANLLSANTLSVQEGMPSALANNGFRLRAIASNGDVSAVSTGNYYPAQSSLAVQPARGHETTGSAEIALSWTPVAGATYYKVYRVNSGNGQPWNLTTTSMTDSGLSWGVVYNYKIAACNAGGCSEYSAQVSERAAPTPAAFTAIRASSTSASLVVPSLTPDVGSIRVKYCNRTANAACDPDSAPLDTMLSNDPRTFTITGLTAGHTYAVIVISCSGASGQGRQTVSITRTF